MKRPTRLLFFSLLLLSVLWSGWLGAQHFSGQALPKFENAKLSRQFTSYEVYRLDPEGLRDFLSGQAGEVQLQLTLGAHQWVLRMAPSELVGAGYRVRMARADGSVEEAGWRHGTIAWSGEVLVPEGHEAALTVTREMIYGYVALSGEDWFVEPVWFFDPEAPRDLVVVYAASAVRPSGGTCAAMAIEGYERLQELWPSDKSTGDQPEGVVNNCYELELAIASDWLMYQKYGSVAAVESHNVGVMNNVATNYDNEFNHEIQFVIVEQFVSTCSTCDPWTSSTDAGTLLNSFTSWGPSGFAANHDLGQLWTDRDFDGSTVGIAWLGAVCTSWRYHCLQDFSTNANYLRVMTAHEIGHNFDASHNSPPCGCIMDPTINNTNTWSAQSVNTISSFITSLINQGNCLSPCASQVPPVADFSASPTSGCAPLMVQYTDLSSNSPTSWQWSFPGGSPSSSTQQNPVVTYSVPGTYSATLTVSNAAGSDTVTKNDLITVEGAPSASFSYVLSGLTVMFFNTTTGNATSYQWDFGDGTFSTQSDPVHTYAQDGFYQVTLTATNACGSTVFVQVLEVFVPPVAGFSASPTTGCAPLQVQFTDESTPNVLEWSWSFEGAVPNSSTDPNPVVQYQAPGTYGVTLTVSNPAGSDTYSVADYITVNLAPVSAFTTAVSMDTVWFSNASVNATSYQWDFGDGTTSTDANPVHVYAQDGTYVVALTATNECGSTTSTQTVVIQTPPQAGFAASTTSGCVPLSVQFADQSSSNVLAWEWHFEGGTPNLSADPNPVVVYYAPGVWDVTLIVHNGAGSDTLSMPDLIVVDDLPVPAFVASVSFDTVSFVNASQNATSYSWDFGDGHTSTAAEPVHIYEADGTYTVVLTATNACGSQTAAQQIAISTQPVAAFTASPTSGCAPLTVQFVDESSANATSWSWVFEGGTPSSSTQSDPVVTYQAAGVYGVTLTVSNAAGSSTVAYADLIEVGTAPTAMITGVSISGATAAFTSAVADADSLWWDFGDGTTSSEAAPQHTYGADDAYTVVLTAVNACGVVSVDTLVVIATEAPVAAYTSDVQSGCPGMQVQFENLSSANAQWFEWTFEGGVPSVSTEPHPLVVYEQPGTYDVMLVAGNAVGSDTFLLADWIVVLDPPVAAFDFDVNDTTAVVAFIDNAQWAESWYWHFGDGATSTDPAPVHAYEQVGTFSVMQVVSNACGADTAWQEVYIAGVLPTAMFAADTTSGCAPLTVQFVDQSSGMPQHWYWTFPGGMPATSTDPNPVVTYAEAGVYDVSLEVTNLAGSHMLVQTSYIVVADAPEAAFSFVADSLGVQFDNLTTGATSYLWDFGDGATSQQVAPHHEYAQAGTYEVSLIAFGSCGTDTVVQAVQVTLTGLDLPSFVRALRLYPNPNDGRFAVEVEHAWPLELQLIDMWGRRHHTATLDTRTASRVWIEGRHLPKGVYLLRLSDGRNVWYEKVVIQ